jgi:hypothetical protein
MRRRIRDTDEEPQEEEEEEEEEKSARLSVTIIFSSSPFTHRVYIDGSDIVPHSLFALTISSWNI